MAEILYVFNSGSRGRYLENVLITLCLPWGATNNYSYDSVNNVAPEVLSRILAYPEGSDVVVLFIDRYGQPGYVYHPLRRARLVRSWVSDNRLNLRLKLEDFCAARDVQEFSRQVGETLKAGGVAARKGDPDNTSDGNYVVFGPNLMPKTPCDIGASAWQTIVQRLALSEAFRTTENQMVVFAKTQLFDDRDPANAISPTYRPSEQSTFQLRRGRKYRLAVVYNFPRQQVDSSSRAEMTVEFGAGLRSTSGEAIAVNAAQREAEFLFTATRDIEDAYTRMTLSFEGPQNVKTFYAPKVDFPIGLVEASSFWIILTVAALFYFFGDMLSSGSTSMVPRVLGALMQTAAVVTGFLIAGKKLV